MGSDLDIERTIAEALAACGARSVKQTGARHWRLAFTNGEQFTAIAVAGEDWLEIEVQSPAASKRPPRAARPWECLEWNPGLSGGVKFALAPPDRCPRIRVELPLEEGGCQPEALRMAGLGLKRAVGRLCGKAEAGKPDRAGRAEEKGAAEAGGSDLEALCASAGWGFTRRASGRIAVELEAPDCPAQAIVARRGAGLAATVELLSCDALSAKSRHAAALLLLTACGLVRMVRSTAGGADGRTVLGYEVTLEPSPTDGQLGRGLSALSVACRLCGPQEVEAMQDEHLAQRYLAVRGWEWPAAGDTAPVGGPAS